MFAVIIKAPDLYFGYGTAAVSHNETWHNKNSLVSQLRAPQGAMFFICHLERNEIKEIRGCHERISFIPESVPPTSDVPRSTDREQNYQRVVYQPGTDDCYNTVYYQRAECQESTYNSSEGEYQTIPARGGTDTAAPVCFP